MKPDFTKGKANRETLSDRMKRYEAVTTDIKLMERVPVYARIDQRAGHSWCHDLDKPFDSNYSDAMKAATSYIVDKTGAILGYCQSDEASFVWKDHTKIPFETRLFKLQSVLSSMFTAAFIKACIGTKLWEKIEKCNFPTFDCRVLNLSSLSEAANMILWREKDSIKNSITLLSLEYFSSNEIHKKNSDDKIKMLLDKEIDYWAIIPEDFRNGAYFRREVYDKVLSNEELSRIPQDKLPEMSIDGKYRVKRSHVAQFYLKSQLVKIDNKVDVLFNYADPILISTNR